jgi:hypothetical protein
MRLAGLERVVEAPELVEGREVELAAVRGLSVVECFETGSDAGKRRLWPT